MSTPVEISRENAFILTCLSLMPVNLADSWKMSRQHANLIHYEKTEQRTRSSTLLLNLAAMTVDRQDDYVLPAGNVVFDVLTCRLPGGVKSQEQSFISVRSTTDIQFGANISPLTFRMHRRFEYWPKPRNFKNTLVYDVSASVSYTSQGCFNLIKSAAGPVALTIPWPMHFSNGMECNDTLILDGTHMGGSLIGNLYPGEVGPDIPLILQESFGIIVPAHYDSKIVAGLIRDRVKEWIAAD